MNWINYLTLFCVIILANFVQVSSRLSFFHSTQHVTSKKYQKNPFYLTHTILMHKNDALIQKLNTQKNILLRVIEWETKKQKKNQFAYFLCLLRKNLIDECFCFVVQSIKLINYDINIQNFSKRVIFSTLDAFLNGIFDLYIFWSSRIYHVSKTYFFSRSTLNFMRKKGTKDEQKEKKNKTFPIMYHVWLMYPDPSHTKKKTFKIFFMLSYLTRFVLSAIGQKPSLGFIFFCFLTTKLKKLLEKDFIYKNIFKRQSKLCLF